MLLLPQLTVDLQGNIWVRLQLRDEPSLQRRTFLRRPTWNRSDIDVACLPSLFEIPFDGGS